MGMSRLKILSPFWNSAWHFIWHIFFHSEFLSTYIYIYACILFGIWPHSLHANFFCPFFAALQNEDACEKNDLLGFLAVHMHQHSNPVHTAPGNCFATHPPDLLLFPAIFGGWCNGNGRDKLRMKPL